MTADAGAPSRAVCGQGIAPTCATQLAAAAAESEVAPDDPAGREGVARPGRVDDVARQDGGQVTDAVHGCAPGHRA